MWFPNKLARPLKAAFASPLAYAIPALLAVLVFFACRIDNGAGNVYMDVKSDTSWVHFDTLMVILKSGGKTDTLFNGVFKSPADLENLSAPDYGGGPAQIEIVGINKGKVTLDVTRQYDGSTTTGRDTTVKPIKPPDNTDTGLSLSPDTLLLFLGGPTGTLSPQPASIWGGRSLSWNSVDTTVATVSASGTVSPVRAGATYIYAVSGGHSAQARVQVVKDSAVLDAGLDTAVRINASVLFRVKTSQAYGSIAAFWWDLDGDGKWDDSALAFPKDQTLLSAAPHTYSSTQDITVHFYVRDTEGNVSLASRKVRVTDKVPLIDSLSAKPALVSINDSVAFAAQVEVTGGALAKYAWDYDGDGAADETGSLSGTKATIAGKRAYARSNVYKASLTVTDSSGTSVTGQVSVDVREDAPTAEAGDDTSVDAGATVKLHGVAHDTLGRIVKMEWKIGSGDYAVTPNGDTSFTPTAATNVRCWFRATDDDGLTAVDSLLVTVRSTDAPIISGFNVDTVITIKDSVVFRGKADARSGNLKSVSWDFDGDGKADATGSLSGTSANLNAGHLYTAVNDTVYTATVTVTDEGNHSASALVKITVKKDPPTASAGKDTSLKAGTTVNLHGSGHDGMGRIVKLEWKIGSADYVEVQKGDYSFTAPATAGDVICLFRVTDDDGLTAEASVTVTVNDLKAPTIAFVDHDTVITIKDSVLFSALVTPGDGPVTGFAWDFDGDGKPDSSGTLNATSPVTLSVKHYFPTAGPFNVILKTSGAYTASAQVHVTVKQDLPLVDAGPDVTVAAGATVTLHGTAVDSLGTIVKREWKIGGGPFLTITKNDTSFTAPSVGGLVMCYFQATDDDGQTVKDSVQVFVSASTDATLASLVPSAGAFAPAFTPASAGLSLALANNVSSITLTPTSANSGATIKINGVAVNSGAASGAISLAVGSNSIAVVVTAQDGSTTKTYTVSATRAGDGNNDLSGLALSVGALSPAFSASTTSYTATVSNATTGVLVTPTLAAATSTIKVNGSAAANGSPYGPVSLAVGANNIFVTVYAEDGTPKVYTVAVTRLNNDATLSDISLSAGALSPAFDPTKTSYTASVPNTSSSITVTPTATDANATIKVNGTAVASGKASGAIALAVGANPITISVTAQDGTPKSYSLSVTRAISNNADLSSLKLKLGILSTTFNAGITTYTGVCTFNQTADSIIAVPADAGATFKIDGVAGASGAGRYTDTLKIGKPNTHTITVTAADGVTVKTYTLNVYREGMPSPYLGYALVTNDTGITRTLGSSVAYTTSPGGTVKVTHKFTGIYFVTFQYLGQAIHNDMNGGGHADVTAGGSGGNYCAVQSTSGYDQDLVVAVDCYKPSGDLVDNSFYLNVHQAYASSVEQNGYAYADQTTTGSYTPSYAYAYNSGHGDIAISRSATGSYAVKFTALNASGNKLSIKVNADNESNNHCVLDSWTSAADVTANVKCYGPTGSAADGVFNVDAIGPFSVGSGYAQGFALANNLTTSSTNLLDANGYNSTGGGITGQKTATGTYSVTFAGLNGANTHAGSIQVTPYGGSGSCSVVTQSGGTDMTLTVDCYNAAGALADNSFAIWALK